MTQIQLERIDIEGQDQEMTTAIMPCELVQVPSQALAVCAGSAERVQVYLESAQARNTIRGYRSSLRLFETWCYSAGASSLPASAETIALYLGAQAGRSRCTRKDSDTDLRT
jgi:hypothetical protein